MPETK